MTTAIILVFVAGYAAIAFEHPIRINKTASAILIGVLTWTLYTLSHHEGVNEELRHHLGSISEILFFLLGAMTIVELVDAHRGFAVISDRITAKSAVKLLWILSFITFFLSAILDNLTTSIVMVTLLRRLVHNPEQRKFFAGMVIIAANAGGAWSPIGDVTTTMLWIGNQITTEGLIKSLFIPSVISLVVPLIVLSFTMKGEVERKHYDLQKAKQDEKVRGSITMLIFGVGGLIFVPIFKTFTHLPPYMGMLISLAVIWVVSEILHFDEEEEMKKPYTAVHALTKIDTQSVLFFLGILLAIGCLESIGILNDMAVWMNDSIGNQDVIVYAIGCLSAVVDNVPLVAATQGMYSLTEFPTDSKIWEFIAYCAGTGGSMLIIGSAAGVAVMGMEKIDFMWYMKKISLWALIGYTAGAVAYLGIYYLMH